MVGDEDELLSVRETARRLGVHENTVRNWARNGTLADARIPGASFHRFRAGDIDRLQRQRGRVAASLQGERRAVNPEFVTASQLNRWPLEASRDAQQNLPELVRRLLAETPGVSGISVRAGDGIALGGWDGTANSEGSAYLPAGSLAFEIGVTGKVAAKADDDYRKRASEGPHDRVFVFVTPRRWKDKESWAEARRAEGQFRDVKVLDADDIEGWLNASPGAHYWISEHFGLRPRDARTIDEWWRRFAEQTKPHLPAALFLAGRSGAARDLEDRLRDKPSLTTIQSDSAEDCLAFVSASVGTGESAASKTVVIVESPEVWDRIVEQPGQTVLVPLFDSPDVGAALDGGHHVISVVDRASVTRRAVDIALPRVDRRAASTAFEKAGLDYREADRFAVLARRSLPALRRSIAIDPKFKRPAWAHDADASVLALLVLAGSWTASDHDMELLSSLTERTASDLVQVMSSAAAGVDPVLRRVGSTWMVVSPEESFIYLAESLSHRALSSWHRAVRDVLLEADPTLDMTSTERLTAQWQGQVRRVSPILRRGVATGIALAGSIGAATGIDGQRTISDAARGFVRDLLQEAAHDATGRTWRHLADSLPLLAEAAPDEFLVAVDDDLRRDRHLLGLFREDEDAFVFGSSSSHHHLLWAIETVCWSDDYLLDGIRALARLAEIEPGGRSGNRPAGSMSTILCGWSRNTAATFETRVEALDAAADVSTDVAWRLIRDLWPSSNGWVTAPSSPAFRENWMPSDRAVAMAEWAEFAHQLVLRALRLAPGHCDRLCALPDMLATISASDRSLVVDLLRNELRQRRPSDPYRLAIWEALRQEVRKHQRFSTSDWAMPAKTVAELDELVSRYEPADAPGRHAHLFSWHVDLPGINRTDHDLYDRTVTQLRHEAIAKTFLGHDRLERLAALAKHCETPGLIGYALATADGITPADTITWLSSPDDALRDVAVTFTRRALADSGKLGVRSVLRLEGVGGAARELLLNCLPATSESWRELADSPVPSDTETYWRTATIDVVEPQDAMTAVAELVAHGRAWTAIGVLAYAIDANGKGPAEGEMSVLDAPRVVDLLNRVLEQQPSPEELARFSSYQLGELLDLLVDRKAAESDIARFEFAFYRLLEHQRQPIVLDRVLAREPEVFVDLVKRVYRGKNEPRRGRPDADSNLAAQAWSVLKGWGGFPGRSDDGTVDNGLLRQWIATARLMLSDADREDIGDEVIGEAFARCPYGQDDIWPAEPIRDLIESIGSRELENGFVIGRLNSRGVTTRSVFEGGRQEHDLANQYRGWSKATRSKWPRTSRILQSIADSHERDAVRQDTKAELDADLI